MELLDKKKLCQYKVSIRTKEQILHRRFGLFIGAKFRGLHTER